MRNIQDIAIVKPDKYNYDIAFDDDNQDILSTDSLNTAYHVAIMTKKRADASEKEDARYRQGWIGDLYDTLEIGSKLWLHEQARSEQIDLNSGENAIRQSIQEKFVDQGIIDAVSVKGEKLECGTFEYSIELKKKNDPSSLAFSLNVNTQNEERKYALINNNG